MQIVKICNDNRDEIVRDAYRALEAIGGKAAPAIPYLTRVLLNEKYPSNCRAGNARRARQICFTSRSRTDEGPYEQASIDSEGRY